MWLSNFYILFLEGIGGFIELLAGTGGAEQLGKLGAGICGGGKLNCLAGNGGGFLGCESNMAP